jgi:hypothetical protein
MEDESIPLLWEPAGHLTSGLPEMANGLGGSGGVFGGFRIIEGEYESHTG